MTELGKNDLTKFAEAQMEHIKTLSIGGNSLLTSNPVSKGNWLKSYLMDFKIKKTS